jgi:bifunctional DNA-binding transcriptional regulator/antitoxin component of YhaV-PrlF toxin-antitoxin module
MAEIVKVDKSGRIVIPGHILRELGMEKGGWFLLSARGKGRLLLQKLDAEPLAEQLEEELAGRDVGAVVRAVRKEINEKIKERYPDLLARRQTRSAARH